MKKEENNPSPYRQYISTVRELAKFMRANGDLSACIASEMFSIKRYRPEPYYLTEEEIRQFFDACLWSVSYSRGRYRPIVFPSFFALMHCCGLRTIEARTLLCEDTHLVKGYIDIVAAKQHRDRRIFLGEDILSHLAKYDENISRIFPDRRYFFPSSAERCVSSNSVAGCFNAVWDAAGLRRKSGKQPRPYDFRHHFAFANINRWTSNGKNVNAMLPYLMRYMGHGSLDSTYYYIHLVPDFFASFGKLTESLEDIIPEVCHECWEC